MRRPNPNHQEDEVTFGNRLSFIELRMGGGDDNVMPWPCLLFDNIQELLTVLGNRGMLTCPHMLRRINVEYIQQQHAGFKEEPSLRLGRRQGKHDPVVFLFGDKTPGGHRVVFLNNNNSNSTPTTTTVRNYKEAIADAIDVMQNEPCFMNALNETSPILGDLLAAEMASPDRLPDAASGEHAPAA